MGVVVTDEELDNMGYASIMEKEWARKCFEAGQDVPPGSYGDWWKGWVKNNPYPKKPRQRRAAL